MRWWANRVEEAWRKMVEMSYRDMPIDELRAYRPALPVPLDMERFWASTLLEARGHPLEPAFAPVDTGLSLISTFDVSFAGADGTRVQAWLHVPAGPRSRLPAVVEFVGYGGGRGLPHERVMWAAAGYAHLVMDTRGQGSTWSVGETPDRDPVGAPAHPGFMTRGILDPLTYYYRRVYVDAVRAVEAVRLHPAVDPGRVAVAGTSQGGGLSIVVAGLVPDLLAAMPEVPFLSDFPRSITFAETDPYAEIARYLKVHRDHVDRVLETLSYFDAAIVGRWAKAPALFSVALMDQICPPSTVFAAYNWYGGPKEIREYAFNDHEGGEGFHEVAQLRWLKERLDH